VDDPGSKIKRLRGRPKGEAPKKTPAERQSTYRKNKRDYYLDAERRLKPPARINLWVTLDAKMTLEQIATHWGLTQQEALNRLILEAGEAITKGMTTEAHKGFLQGYKK